MDNHYDISFHNQLSNKNLDINQICDLIIDNIKKVAHRTIGIRTATKHKRKKLPRDLVDAIKERKQARIQYSTKIKQTVDRGSITDSWNYYISCKKIVAVKKQALRNSINIKTCDRIVAAGRNSSKLFWQEVSKGGFKSTINELLIDNVFITEKEEILNEIEKHFKQLAYVDTVENDLVSFEDDTTLLHNEHNYADRAWVEHTPPGGDHEYCKKKTSEPKNQWYKCFT